MTDPASPKKGINWTQVWAAAAALAAVGTLIFVALQYFQSSPYKLEARGEYFRLNYPNSLLGISGEVIDYIGQGNPKVSPTPAPTPPPILPAIGQLIELSKYRHNFLFVLQNKGNKEVKDIKLMFPGGGLYELMRKAPVGKTESFNNEIPVGAMSPTEEVSILVWTDNERARDATDRMRFVHPEGVVPIRFGTASSFPTWLDIAQSLSTVVLAIIMLYFLLVVRKSPNLLFTKRVRTRQEGKKTDE
ncbi:MAG: hypothetical protein M3362_00365 [Acidobacteriota bacterium]|nr:hypothetical protein [Acidobacteriota bacterium]